MTREKLRLGPSFETLYQHCDESRGCLELRLLPSGRQEFLPWSQDDVEQIIASLTHQNVYFGVATRKDGSSGALKNCQELPAFFVDIDFKDAPEDKARKLLKDFALPPSIVIQSGNGLHVYWLLKEPLVLDEPGVPEMGKDYLRRLVLALKGDLNAAEPARVFRPPATLNYKYAPPRNVYIEVWEPARVYDMPDFDDWLPEEDISQALHKACNGDEAIPEFQRNTTLASLAGTMRNRSFCEEAIEAALQKQNQAKCQPPLEEAEVRRIAKSIGRYSPALPDCPQFAVEVLPGPLGAFVEEAAQAFPCPRDFVAIPLLVNLGAAVGYSRVLEIKPGWQESTRLWAAFVAEPGSMKTPVFSLVTQPMYEQERKNFEVFKELQQQYEIDLVEWEIELKRYKVLKSQKNTPLEDIADGPPEKPEAPTRQRTAVQDITIETLGKILGENSRGVVLLADELAGWFRGIGQYKKTGGADRKYWLSIWSHSALTVDRLTRDPLYVPNPFVSIVGGIQPQALKDLDPEEGLKDGFMHRLLLVEPEPMTVHYTETCVRAETLQQFKNLFAQLFSLHLGPGGAPQPLQFTPEAKQEWVRWYNAHCLEHLADGFPFVLKGPWAKLRGYSATLALILALAQDPHATMVDLDPTLGAITLIEEYFKPHLRRLYPQMLKRERSEFEKCRGAIVQALRTRALLYKPLRHKIGGRFKGELVRAVLEDLQDSEEVVQHSTKEYALHVLETVNPSPPGDNA